MPQADFTIQTTEKSHCGQCNGPLDLLIEDNLNKKNLFIFYICWPCKRVVQAGFGDVPREGPAPALDVVAQKVIDLTESRDTLLAACYESCKSLVASGHYDATLGVVRAAIAEAERRKH